MPAGTGGVPVRGPSSDKGWFVHATCPHGTRVDIPLRLVRGLDTIEDPCDQAREERIEEQVRLAAQERLTFRERRRIRKALKQLKHL